MTTHGAFGLVDTAAQSGLIGEGALSRLQVALNSFGLKVKKTDKKAQARGVGGEAKVQGVVEIPMGLGGVNGVLEATVVQEDVPLLIPVRLLRDLRAVIDFSKEQVQLMKYDRSTPMTILPSGHASISIVDFASEGWSLPIEAKVRGMREEDFMIEGQHAPRTREAMPAWSNLFVTSPQRNVSLFADGGVASSAAGNAEEGRRGGELYGHVAHGKEGQNGLDGAGWKGPGGDQNSRSASSQEVRDQQMREVALLSGGYPHGSLALGSAGVGPPPLPTFQGLSKKQQELVRQMKDGMQVAPRKCQMPPRVAIEICTHPPSSLTAAGNQYQREVWRQDCHARWKVSTVAREASKQSVHVASTLLTPTSRAISAVGTPTTPGVGSTSSVWTPSPAKRTTLEQEMRCTCNKPAQRLLVKKDGPTKGRHFYRCHARLCEYFQWDPVELKELQEKVALMGSLENPEVSPEVNKMKEEMEEAKKALEMRESDLKTKEEQILQIQQSLNQGAQSLVSTVVQQAEARHQEVLGSQTAQYQTQLQTMQDQLYWMTALAGEERIGEVMRSPEESALIYQRAVDLKNRMALSEETQAMRSEGPAPSQ